MIEYLYQEGVAACSREPLKVRLDGRIVGEIRAVPGGFQYCPKGFQIKGNVYASVAEVQRSLLPCSP